MSLSKDDNDKNDPSASSKDTNWGTIFSSGRELSLGGLESTRSSQWTKEDEQAYLERIKQHAVAKAMKIVEEAKAEANQIRQQAAEHGYNEGIQQAEKELEDFRNGMADSVSAVLGAIEGQCSQIFDQWRDDLVAIAKLAVEKISCVEMKEERQQMLANILSQTVATLESRRELIIKVHPEDEPMLADIIGLTKDKFPDVNVWRTKADTTLTPGSIMLETSSSLAESKAETRQKAVAEVLSHLTLADNS